MLPSQSFILFLASAAAAGPVASSPAVAPTERGGSLVRRAPSEWVHPGILMNQTQLDFMRSQVVGGKETWTAAYARLNSNSWASPTREPSPVETVQCGSYSNPDVGCTSERYDAMSAYATSLMWYITRNQTFADKSVQYMNAWSSTIKAHNDSNAPLQSGWVASVWTRAAEIIRYSDAGWSSSDVSRFEAMLTDVYLPKTLPGNTYSGGNWDLVMMEASMNIAVFTESPDTWDAAMDRFLDRVPAYIYMTSDGPYPVAPPGSGYTESQVVAYWFDQPSFEADGLMQETCRDLEHSGYGIASISHVAETALIQGIDLYETDVGARLRSAMEFHTPFGLGQEVPSWLCNGTLNLSLVNVTEVAYSALAIRKGFSMPNSRAYTAQQRPGGAHSLFVAWETLTHALTDL